MPNIFREQPPTSTWIDRGWYLVTEFEQSSSVNFQKAVALAQTHPGFIRLMDERNILIYRNMYRDYDIQQFQQLYRLITHWKGMRLYFKGTETVYDAIESGIACYIRTKLERTAENGDDAPDDGCRTFDEHRLETAQHLGCIGCHRSGISLEWPPEPGNDRVPWFFYGRLNQQQVYLLNKDDIQQTAHGHLMLYAACPLLDLEKIAHFVQRLPDRIDPRKDREWTYRALDAPADTPVRFHRLPAVLPKNQEAYRLYLKRML